MSHAKKAKLVSALLGSACVLTPIAGIFSQPVGTMAAKPVSAYAYIRHYDSPELMEVQTIYQGESQKQYAYYDTETPEFQQLQQKQSTIYQQVKTAVQNTGSKGQSAVSHWSTALQKARSSHGWFTAGQNSTGKYIKIHYSQSGEIHEVKADSSGWYKMS